MSDVFGTYSDDSEVVSENVSVLEEEGTTSISMDFSTQKSLGGELTDLFILRFGCTAETNLMIDALPTVHHLNRPFSPRMMIVVPARVLAKKSVLISTNPDEDSYLETCRLPTLLSNNDATVCTEFGVINCH